MSVENRKKTRDVINKIETSYPVNEWMHNGYHIWPVLRIRLFMMLIKQKEGSRGVSGFSDSQNYGFISKLIKAVSAGIHFHSISPKKYKKLYFGAPQYRMDYLGKRYNGFFDPFIDQDGLMIEYHADTKENFYKSERVLIFGELSRYFRLFETKFWSIKSESEYPHKMQAILQNFDIEIENVVSSLKTYIHSVDRNYFTCHKILKKIQPEKVFLLFYYSNRMLGLNIAAHKLNIPTYEMQHGSQGALHLAYGSWKNVPKQGYEALPNVFQTWDDFSAEAIEEWAKTTEKHSAVVTGNPWVEGWKNGRFKSINFDWPDNIILYTLQPIGNPLEPYILETIKQTSKKWNWWLRLHPRQEEELETLKNELQRHGILHNVNIKDATQLPLPEILVNTSVHITKFSSSAIEAFNFDVPTIVLDERGEEMFKNYLNTDKMICYSDKSTAELVSKINSFMETRNSNV